DDDPASPGLDAVLRPQEREVAGLADGDDDAVGRDGELRARDELRGEAAALVEHPRDGHELDAGHVAALADEALGPEAVAEADPFALGLLDLVRRRRHLAFRLEAADRHFARAKSDGAARHIQGLDDRQVALQVDLLATPRRRAGHVEGDVAAPDDE